MSERAIQADVLYSLQKEWPDGLFWRRNVGAARDMEGNFIRFGHKGMADIEGMVGGHHIEIEVKALGKYQTKDQKNWQRAVERAGGLYVVARSRDDAIAAVRRWLYERGYARP